MKYRRRNRFIFFPFIGIAAVLLFGLAVMLLWNAVLPQVLKTGPLTYWQAVGLLVLCRILFGGFRGAQRFDGRRDWRGGPPWRHKWTNMGEEEKAKLREEWKRRCAPRDEENKPGA